MIILWVLLWVLLLFLALLCCPLTFFLSYEDQETSSPPYAPPPPDTAATETEQILSALLSEARQTAKEQSKPEKQLLIKIQYLFLSFQLFPWKHKKAKPKPEKEKKAKPEKDPAKETESTSSSSLSTVLILIGQVLESARLPLRLLRHSVLVHHLRLTIVVAKEDASGTAIAYSRLCALLCFLLGLADGWIKTRGSNLTVIPNFSGDPALAECAGRVKIRLLPIGFLVAVILFAGSFFIKFLKQKKNTPESQPAQQKG